jgi:hypothetical protein
MFTTLSSDVLFRPLVLAFGHCCWWPMTTRGEEEWERLFDVRVVQMMMSVFGFQSVENKGI